MNALKAFFVCSASLLATACGCPLLDFNFEIGGPNVFVAPIESIAPDELVGSFMPRSEHLADTATEAEAFQL